MKEQFPEPPKPKLDKIAKVYDQSSFDNINKITAKSGWIVFGTDKGKRKSNQDTVFLNTEQDVFGIADGMGGYAHGDLAAKIVSEEIIKGVNQDIKPKQMQQNAYKRILEETNTYEPGAVYTAAQIEGKKLNIWSAGDCTLLIADLNGKIKFKSEYTDLRNAPSGRGAGIPNTEKVGISNHDRIYVFSDGAADNLFELEKNIYDLRNTKIEESIKNLSQTAIDNMNVFEKDGNIGNKDNVSILIYQILPVPQRP